MGHRLSLIEFSVISINQVSISINQVTMGFDLTNFVDTIAAEGEMQAEGRCSCCRGLWRDPVMLYDCRHVFCRKCITAWCSVRQTCPNCRMALKYVVNWFTINSEMMPPGVMALRMKCVNEHLGCDVVSTVETFDQHHRSCQLRQQRVAALYDQLLLEYKLPLGTRSPRLVTKAHCQ